MFRQGEEPAPGYILEKLVGRGAFAEVWCARDYGGVRTALKLIALQGRQGLQEYFSILRLGSYRHSRLLPVEGSWILDEQGQPIDTDSLQSECAGDVPDHRRPVVVVLAMPLADQSLFHVLDQWNQQGIQGIPPQDLLDYLADAAKGLDYLNHSDHGEGANGIQHGDVKPHNILLFGNVAKASDVGLARILSDRRSSIQFAASAVYAAPECLRDNQPSRHTDQYSLAITYHELRTGRLPFDAETPGAVFDAHLRGKMNLSLLPAAEQTVIERAMSLHPADRFNSSGQLVAALRTAVQATGTDDPRITRIEMTGSGIYGQVDFDPAVDPNSPFVQRDVAVAPLETGNPFRDPEFSDTSTDGKSWVSASSLHPESRAGQEPSDRGKKLLSCLVLVLLLAFGAVVAWQLRSPADPAAETDRYTITFDPRHANVLIDGQERVLVDGQADVHGEEDSEIQIEAIAGSREFKQSLTVADLRRRDWRVKLKRRVNEFVIALKPVGVKVTINGLPLRVNVDGKIRVKTTKNELELRVFGVAGYEDFQGTISIDQLRSDAFVIELAPTTHAPETVPALPVPASQPTPVAAPSAVAETVAPPVSVPKVDDYLGVGDEHYDNDRFLEAIRCYETGLDEDSERSTEYVRRLARVYLARGKVRLDRGDYRGAEADFVRSNSRSAAFEALLWRGRALVEGKDFTTAISVFRISRRKYPAQAKRLNPDFADAYYRRAKARYQRNEFESSVLDLELAAKTDQATGERIREDRIQVLLDYAVLLRDKKDYRGAVRRLTEAIDLNPVDQATLFILLSRRAECYRKRGGAGDENRAKRDEQQARELKRVAITPAPRWLA